MRAKKWCLRSLLFSAEDSNIDCLKDEKNIDLVVQIKHRIEKIRQIELKDLNTFPNILILEQKRIFWNTHVR